MDIECVIPDRCAEAAGVADALRMGIGECWREMFAILACEACASKAARGRRTPYKLALWGILSAC